MQRPFTAARWDADLVPDDLRHYVAGALGDPDGVLIGTIPGSRGAARVRPGGSGSTPGERMVVKR